VPPGLLTHSWEWAAAGRIWPARRLSAAGDRIKKLIVVELNGAAALRVKRAENSRCALGKHAKAHELCNVQG
jgi:hypothetical protein